MGRRVNVTVAVAIAMLAVGASPAFGAGSVSYVRQFGGVGSASGDLNVAGGMAVDDATGNVYVADNDNERIDEFNSSGGFVKAWGAGVADGSSTTYQTCTSSCRQGVASGSAGALNRPQSIALDPSGNLFVADSANNRIVEFDTSGGFEQAWGWGVTDGQQQFETCTTTCQSGTASGGSGGLSAPYGVAVTPSGDVVVAEYHGNRISEFDPSQNPVAFVRAWGSVGAGASQFDGVTGIGVDPSSGDVYAVDTLNYRVQQFTSAGSFIRAWGWGVADGQSRFETCGDTGAGCQSGISGSGTGQFAYPIQFASGVVVDPSGAVDVIDAEGNRVQQFSRGGSFLNMFGWGVADGQNQFENCTSGCQAGKSGTGAGQIWGPSGLATDATGHLYVDNTGTDTTEVFSSTVASTTHRLTAAKAGAGSGTVTSSAAGIDCGSTCSAPFDGGSQVTLTATPASGSSFTGWSGGGCSGTATCTVTLGQDTTVTATFGPSGCDDTFTGANAADWGNPANWSAGVPGSSTVACWSGKTVDVSGQNATAASIVGGDLSIGTNGSLKLASSTGSSSVGALSITDGHLNGPSGASLSVNGDFSWDALQNTGINTDSGAALAISQTAGHSVSIFGSGEALLYGGSIQTPNPITISDTNFAGSGLSTITTSGTVTFAPGSYQANGGVGIVISAAGMITSGDTSLPNFALHLTGGTTSIPSGRTVSAVSIAVDGGTLEGDGTITGSLTNTGGTVAPGSTLVVTGGYTQQSGGRLAIAVSNTTAGSGYSVLSVGGNVTLDGTLALAPSSGYASSAQGGDRIAPLTYSGSRTGQFAATTVNPALDGGRSFTADYGTTHEVDAVVGVSSSQHTLSVGKSGSGTGTVTSSPAGINCGATCSASFDDGTQVTLTAAHDGASTFGGWSGGGCSGTQTTCALTMGSAESVTAEFDEAAPSVPTGLSASPASSSEIDLSWNAVSGATGYVVKRGTSPGGPYTQVGAPSGASFADRGLSAATTYYYVVKATNAGGSSPNSAEASATTETTENAAGSPSTLTVAKAGSGAGTISSAPAGINCGSTCTAQFANGTQVTLTVAPGAGSLFTGWGGGGCSGTGNCTVTVSGSATVTAGFEPAGGLAPVPPGAVAAMRAPSARPGVVGSLLVLNPTRRRATVALLCRARAGSSCTVTGMLRRRGTTLGTVAGRLPGQRIGTLAIHLGPAAHTLPPTPHPGSLVLTSSAPGLGTAHVVQSVTLQKQLPAGKPPLVSTESASDIVPVAYGGSGAPGSAVIAGTVNPRGLATRYHFEVGLAPGQYDTDLPASDASAGHGELTQLETARVPNLGLPVSTHYRIVAESAGGVAYGPDRSFTLPIATPGSNIAPIAPDPASTIAGPVSLNLSQQCIALGEVVTGGVIQCTIQAADPQPPVLDVGVGTAPVPGVSTVLDAVAPAGTAIDVTGAPDQAFPMVLAPSAGPTLATVSFRIEHPPPVSLIFQATDGFDAPAFATVRAPEQPRVSASVNCSPGRPGAKSSSAVVAPGAPVTCKVTTRNAGFDAADFSTFSIAPKADLVDPRTVAGGPPAVLRGAVAGNLSSTTTIELRVSPTAHPGAKLSVAVSAAGSNETDRAPFFVTAVSNDLTVRGQR